ncbi:MAG: ABC transporter permease [Niameybacter sp.]|uniref:ABC transporter permease n=1 Tax=Niameybacter sp. TaxID=2033640 RepID=UPI002FC7A49F
MIFPTNNQQVIRKLSKRSLKGNKLRNLFAVIAITLTTILFTSVFTIGLGMLNSFQESNFRMAGGYSHGGFKSLTKEQYEQLKAHPLIKESGLTVTVGLAENEGLMKSPTEIRYVDENVAKWRYIQIQEGHMPQGVDEVALDTVTLDLLGIPYQLGAQVPVMYLINEEIVTKTLTLAGIYEKEQGVDVSQILVSLAFIEENLKDVEDSIQNYGVGDITLDVMLKPVANIESGIDQIARDYGYEADGKGENGINVGVNWGYSHARQVQIDPMMVIAGVGGCLLIIFTGYLIIYNIFQISVMADIRYYGLLKTIGTTPKQIKKMIRNQAMYLSVVGIPIGLLLGYIIGSGLLKIVMQSTNYPVAYGTLNPVIFIGSTAFALVTVWISCHKPGHMAAHISPIEAAKYSEVSGTGKKKVGRTKPTSLWAMAYRNINRNKKKTAIIVVSMSLSMVLLNSVYTYTQGFDMDKYLERFVVSDFIIGHANYFNVGKHFSFPEDQVDELFVEQLKEQEGFIEGGIMLYDVYGTRDQDKDLDIQLYGMEGTLMENLQVIEGSFELEKFLTGEYILEGVDTNDYGEVYEERVQYEIGEKVTLTPSGESSVPRTFEVMAKIQQNHNATVRYSIGNSASLYLPAEAFVEGVGEALKMAYYMDVEDAYEAQMNAYLEEKTSEHGNMMDFESKQRYIDDFKGTQNMFFIAGFVASFIIGMIGCFNLINAMITSILSRRGEFAILQSMGMTTKQLRKMLVIEGLYYSGMTVIFSFILGIVMSYGIVKPLGETLWYFSYTFKILPLMMVAPLIMLLGVAVPTIIHHLIGKESIVERLRKMD